MNKTQKEIVYSVLESIYKFRIPDDFDISTEFVKKKIDDVNVRLLEEMHKQGESLDAFYQKMCCIEVKCTETACIIDGISIPSSDITWYAELPSLNQKIGTSNIAYFGTSDMKSNFTKKSESGFFNNGELEWSKSPSYVIVGNKAYFKDLPTTGNKFLCLIGILSSPSTACNFNDNTPYPTPDAYKLELLVKQDIVSSLALMPKDEISDSRDGVGSTQATPKQIKPQGDE